MELGIKVKIVLSANSIGDQFHAFMCSIIYSARSKIIDIFFHSQKMVLWNEILTNEKLAKSLVKFHAKMISFFSIDFS